VTQMGVLPTNTLWELDNATVKSAHSFLLGISPGPSAHRFYQCTYGCQDSDAHHALTCDNRSVLGTIAMWHRSSIESQPMGFAGLKFGYQGRGKLRRMLVSALEDVQSTECCGKDASSV
jgi:hypothetical protein